MYRPLGRHQVQGDLQALDTAGRGSGPRDIAGMPAAGASLARRAWMGPLGSIFLELVAPSEGLYGRYWRPLLTSPAAQTADVHYWEHRTARAVRPCLGHARRV